jgi:hypothetical protein
MAAAHFGLVTSLAWLAYDLLKYSTAISVTFQCCQFFSLFKMFKYLQLTLIGNWHGLVKSHNSVIFALIAIIDLCAT